VRIDRLKIFLDSMSGGAWPFLVGGVICLVYSVNERDLDWLTSPDQSQDWLFVVSFRGMRGQTLALEAAKCGLLKGTLGV
jgi:hypothetical protein